MLGQLEPELPSNNLLSLFDLIVAEFLDPSALQTQDMIMMIPLVQFKDRVTAFEMMAFDQASRFELRQDSIHGG